MMEAYNFRRQTLDGDCVVALLSDTYSTSIAMSRALRTASVELPQELWLDTLAYVLGFDRQREESYSSQDFPKLIPHGYLGGARCQRCGLALEQTPQNRA